MSSESRTLTQSEIQFLERIEREYQNRFLILGISVLVGLFLIYLYWNAPFAYSAFQKLPIGESDKMPYYDSRFIIPWAFGVWALFQGVHQCFFDKKRKLLIKLLSKQRAEQGAAANP